MTLAQLTRAKELEALHIENRRTRDVLFRADELKNAAQITCSDINMPHDV